MTVVVTGAAAGIGRATAVAFARRGEHVVCIDIDLAGAQKTAAMCDEVGGSGRAEHLDVADAGGMGALAERLGPVDVLVNNAGVGMSARLLDMHAGDWEWIRSANLDGVVNGCRAFGPAMVARGQGHVVNVSSAFAFTFTATEPAYITTKAAVLALSRCLRADWHKRGVGVSVVCPGVIDTAIAGTSRYRGDAADPRRRRRVQWLFRRGHKPEVVAEAVVEAVRRNRSVVPVGFEARVGWFLSRLAPVWLADRFARVGLVR